MASRRPDQVHRRLRAALLARGRPHRARRSATPGPLETTFDNSPPGQGEGAGPACWSASSPAPRRPSTRCSANPSAAAASPSASSACSARRARHPTAYHEQAWSEEALERRRTGLLAGPGDAHRLRRRAPPPRRAASTGPAPRPRRSGADTWRARSRAASARPARPSMRKDGGCERGALVTEETRLRRGAARLAEMLRARRDLLPRADRALPASGSSGSTPSSTPTATSGPRAPWPRRTPPTRRLEGRRGGAAARGARSRSRTPSTSPATSPRSARRASTARGRGLGPGQRASARPAR